MRDAVADLNHRILQWRRIPLGPPMFLPLVDEDAMVARWHAGQRAPAPPSSPPGSSPPAVAIPVGRSHPEPGPAPPVVAPAHPAAPLPAGEQTALMPAHPLA